MINTTMTLEEELGFPVSTKKDENMTEENNTLVSVEEVAKRAREGELIIDKILVSTPSNWFGSATGLMVSRLTDTAKTVFLSWGTIEKINALAEYIQAKEGGEVAKSEEATAAFDLEEVFNK